MAVNYFNNFSGTSLFSDVSPHMTLTAGTELTYTVPGDATNKLRAVFSYASSANVFVSKNVTVAVPADDTVVTTANVEFKPDIKLLVGGDVLHFITPDTKAYVGVSFSSVPA